MTEMYDQIGEFVNRLMSFAQEGHENRGALADLRSGLRTDPGQAPRMFKHVVPYIGENVSKSDSRWFYVVGAMFGANTRNIEDVSFGKCFDHYAKIYEKKTQMNKDEKKKRGEARFIAILGSHEDDIHHRLYHAIRLFKSENLGIDYKQLLKDLINWNHPDHYVQNKWACDYYRKSNNTEKGEDDNE